MLTSVIEIDKVFDEVLKKSLPYLIFPHKTYRERLASHLEGFCQFHRERNQSAFNERYHSIMAFFKECETEGFDTFTESNIHYLITHQTSLHTTLVNTERRILYLEKAVDTLMTKRGATKAKKDAPKAKKDTADVVHVETNDLSPSHKTEPSPDPKGPDILPDPNPSLIDADDANGGVIVVEYPEDNDMQDYLETAQPTDAPSKKQIDEPITKDARIKPMTHAERVYAYLETQDKPRTLNEIGNALNVPYALGREVNPNRVDNVLTKAIQSGELVVDKGGKAYTYILKSKLS